MLGTPLQLQDITVPTFVTGALTDHLTPWKGCYQTTQLLGGPSTFVLSYSGHIASLVNPPGNPKAHYWTGGPPGADPEQWLARRRTTAGQLVGGLGRLDNGAGRRPAATARSARQRAAPGTVGQRPGSTCATWRRVSAERSAAPDPATLRSAYAATAACKVGRRSVPAMLVIIGLVAPAAR